MIMIRCAARHLEEGVWHGCVESVGIKFVKAHGRNCLDLLGIGVPEDLVGRRDENGVVYPTGCSIALCEKHRITISNT